MQPSSSSFEPAASFQLSKFRHAIHESTCFVLYLYLLLRVTKSRQELRPWLRADECSCGCESPWLQLIAFIMPLHTHEMCKVAKVDLLGAMQPTWPATGHVVLKQWRTSSLQGHLVQYSMSLCCRFPRQLWNEPRYPNAFSDCLLSCSLFAET